MAYNTVQPTAYAYDGFLFAIGSSSLPPREGVGTKAIRVFTEDGLQGQGCVLPTDGHTLIGAAQHSRPA